MFLKKLLLFFKKSTYTYYEKKYKKRIKNLEKRLNIKIQDSDLFLRALTHRSYVGEEPRLQVSNERLEFLGDAVLGLVVAEFLFRNFPDEEEGFLTKIRSRFVYKDALAEASERIKLEDLLFYKHKFIGNSAEGKKTVIADALEAVIGAIYLDGGLEVARHFIFREIIKPNLESGKFRIDKNYKGRLLELTHSLKLTTPVYKVVAEEGPEHDKLFTIEVLLNDEVYGRGSGKSKKSAEQEAAKAALEKLNELSE